MADQQRPDEQHRADQQTGTDSDGKRARTLAELYDQQARATRAASGTLTSQTEALGRMFDTASRTTNQSARGRSGARRFTERDASPSTHFVDVKPLFDPKILPVHRTANAVEDMVSLQKQQIEFNDKLLATSAMASRTNHKFQVATLVVAVLALVASVVAVIVPFFT